MEYWEFLIQKEGVSTWQPLTSPDVELEEDRYRLVVRCSRTDTEVDVRIIHESTDEDPPKRRMQKRSRRTNLEGLMVLVPFTHFKPGIWEFRCRPDFLEDLMGDSWQHSVRLQVLPKAALADAVTDAAPPEESDNPGVSLAELGETEPAESEVPASSTPVPSPEPPQPPKLEEVNPSTPVFAAKPAKEIPQALVLSLSQEIYFAHQGQPVTLSGQVELPEIVEAEISDAETVFAGELRICLRDPQNGNILADRQQPLPAQVLPFSFSCSVQIPANSQTRLFLGEISIYNAAESPVDSPLLLATKSFSITADLNELLSAIADNFTETEVLDLASAKSAQDSTAIETEEIPKTVEFKPLQPSPGSILPPLLYQPDLINKPPKSLDLPDFRNRSAPSAIPDRDSQTTTPQTDLTAAEPEVVESSEETPVSLTEENITAEATQAPGETEPEVENAAENVPPSPTETAFQSLKLDERFWSRLNAIATDAELSSELHIEDILETDRTQGKLAPGSRESLNDLTAYEFVVEDDQPLEALPIKPTRSLKRNASQSPEQVPPEPSPPPKDEPLPIPKLKVPSGELIGGQPVRIRIEMPMRQPRLGVKLWVVEVQTRSVIESPRWIGDFVPDPWGNLEATVQISVPLGCLEIRIEALATELLSGRESHKTSVDRIVIPPNLPTYSSDELDI